jgi:hypothetical protein
MPILPLSVLERDTLADTLRWTIQVATAHAQQLTADRRSPLAVDAIERGLETTRGILARLEAQRG